MYKSIDFGYSSGVLSRKLSEGSTYNNVSSLIAISAPLGLSTGRPTTGTPVPGAWRDIYAVTASDTMSRSDTKEFRCRLCLFIRVIAICACVRCMQILTPCNSCVHSFRDVTWRVALRILYLPELSITHEIYEMISERMCAVRSPIEWI